MKLAERMCKYEIDPASIVEYTEWTRFCPEIDGKMDRQMGKVKPAYVGFGTNGFDMRDKSLCGGGGYGGRCGGGNKLKT